MNIGKWNIGKFILNVKRGNGEEKMRNGKKGGKPAALE
jgi:hypothetical protein